MTKYALVFRANGGFCALETDDASVATFDSPGDALNFGGQLARDTEDGATPNILWLSLAADMAIELALGGQQQYDQVYHQIMDVLDAIAPVVTVEWPPDNTVYEEDYF